MGEVWLTLTILVYGLAVLVLGIAAGIMEQLNLFFQYLGGFAFGWVAGKILIWTIQKVFQKYEIRREHLPTGERIALSEHRFYRRELAEDLARVGNQYGLESGYYYYVSNRRDKLINDSK